MRDHVHRAYARLNRSCKATGPWARRGAEWWAGA